MNTKNITPADVELVRYDFVGVGDVLVAFTPVGRDLVTPPTQRQLRMARTRYTLVESIIHTRTPAGIPVLDMNHLLGDDRRSTALGTSLVWRVRPSSMHLLEV